MKRAILLGVDCGTQSTKAVAYRATGEVLSRASRPNEVSSPHLGWAEQDANSWWHGIRHVLRDVLPPSSAGSVAAVGISFQREGFTLARKQTRCAEAFPPDMLRPAMLWLDTRSHEEVRAFEATEAERRDWKKESSVQYHATTGKPMDATSSVARMIWLRRHEPHLFSDYGNNVRWLDCGSVLSLSLTGKVVTCVVGVDTCGLVDIRTRQWSEALLTQAGLHIGQMPKLAEPGEVVGTLTAAAAAAISREGCAELPIGEDDPAIEFASRSVRAYR